MYTGCSSQSYDDVLGSGRLTLEEWCRLASEELGISAVELEDKHIGEPTPARVAGVRDAAARYGLEIVNIAFMNNGRDARVDHDAAVRLLGAIGYEGCVSVEYEGEEPSRTTVPRIVAICGRRCAGSPHVFGQGE